jgi:BirA family biotin operon repressor/biotin-[acetyl-CoA-carboxylase] ligase
LLLDGRKLAGILCESRWRGREVELVIGFGINVHRERDEFEPDLRARATSLALALAPEHRRGRAAVLGAVLFELERNLGRFFGELGGGESEPGGFAAIRSRYEPHCLVIGETIEVAEPSGRRFIAIAEALDEDGALLVRPREGGPRVRVESADVWLQGAP